MDIEPIGEAFQEIRMILNLRELLSKLDRQIVRFKKCGRLAWNAQFANILNRKLIAFRVCDIYLVQVIQNELE
jgi:hypothetical protein